MSSDDAYAEATEVAPSMRLPAVFRGERLTLRRWMPDDEAVLGRIVTESLEHLLPWMPWARFEPLTNEARRALIEGWESEWRAGGDVTLAVMAGDEPVGSTGLHRRLGPNALEIGYWVHVAHVGRGYATELSRVLTDAAFAIPGIERVEIHHDKANVRSAAVPRKLGFNFEGEHEREPAAPAETGAEWVWTISKEQWLIPSNGTADR